MELVANAVSQQDDGTRGVEWCGSLGLAFHCNKTLFPIRVPITIVFMSRFRQGSKPLEARQIMFRCNACART